MAVLLAAVSVTNMNAQQTKTQGDELRLVIVVSRHGIRAPIESETRGNRFNKKPWPTWPVAPGVLTPHGAAVLRQMGAWYRERYASALGVHSCVPVFAYANETQRTVASARALLDGMTPECKIAVHTRRQNDAAVTQSESAEETPAVERDPVFGAEAWAAKADHSLLAAAIRGQMGGDVARWAVEQKEPLDELQSVFARSGGGGFSGGGLQQLLRDVPSTVNAGKGDSLVDISTPVRVGADFAENFLLEYVEGLPMQDVGWGLVSRTELDRLMAMNTRYHDVVLRTPYFAQVGASEMASRIDRTLQQAMTGKSVQGAFGSTKDRIVMLVGHDSNLTWMGGLLRTQWLLPEGAMNATPPGSAMVFELHRRASGEWYVSVAFVSETLEQMRTAEKAVPVVAPVFVPGCSTSGEGYPCEVGAFHRLIQSAVDSRFVR